METTGVVTLLAPLDLHVRPRGIRAAGPLSNLCSAGVDRRGDGPRVLVQLHANDPAVLDRQVHGRRCGELLAVGRDGVCEGRQQYHVTTVDDDAPQRGLAPAVRGVR